MVQPPGGGERSVAGETTQPRRRQGQALGPVGVRFDKSGIDEFAVAVRKAADQVKGLFAPFEDRNLVKLSGNIEKFFFSKFESRIKTIKQQMAGLNLPGVVGGGRPTGSVAEMAGLKPTPVQMGTGYGWARPWGAAGGGAAAAAVGGGTTEALLTEIRDQLAAGGTGFGRTRGGFLGRVQQRGVEIFEFRQVLDAFRQVTSTLAPVIAGQRVAFGAARMAPGGFRPGAVRNIGLAQAMVPGATGMQDLYGGLAQLQRLGVPTGTRADLANVPASLGMLARIGGTDFTGAAGMMNTLLNPQVQTNLFAGGILGRQIRTSPGGVAANPTRVFQQIIQAMEAQGGGMRPEAWAQVRPGQRPYQQLAAIGLGEQEIETIRQMGMAGMGRGEITEGRLREAGFVDTQENLRQFSQTIRQLGDLLGKSVLPVFTDVVKLMTELVKPVTGLIEHFPGLDRAMTLLGGAFVIQRAAQLRSTTAYRRAADTLSTTFTPAVERATVALSRMSGGATTGTVAEGAKVAGAAGAAGAAGGLMGRLGRLGGRLTSKLGGWTSLGLALGLPIAGEVVGGLVGRGAAPGSGRSRWGSALSSAGQGAALGLAFGGGTPLGAGIGAALGGLAGYFGVGSAEEATGDAVQPAAPYSTAGGGPLPGPGNSAHLNPELIHRLQAMFKENPALYVNSGWRDRREQEYLYYLHQTGRKKAPVAKPGTSKHERGLAVDLGPRSQAAWLQANARRFGLWKAVSSEWWHYEMTGKFAGAPQPAGPGPQATTSESQAPAQSQTRPTAVPTSSGGQTTRLIPIQTAQRPTVTATTMTYGSVEEAASSAAAFGAATKGDAESPLPGFTVYDSPRARMTTGGNVTIHNATFKVEIARGTPEEAERTARYLMEILADRNRLLAASSGQTALMGR